MNLQQTVAAISHKHGGILDKETGRTHFPIGVTLDGSIHVFSAELNRCDSWEMARVLAKFLNKIDKPIPLSRLNRYH